MIGMLTWEQSEHVLASEQVGRIGCYAGGKVYIVPVAYVYHQNFIYSHSNEGLKIRMMRKNSNICFEVESRENMKSWRSVIVWGKYEELKTLQEQKRALKILNDKFFPLVTSESLIPTPYKESPREIEKARKPVIYRISINEMTGRFEKG